MSPPAEKARPAPAKEWRIQAFTDRSAYRPEDAVQWRFLARTRFATEYRTPADQTVHWQIRDPHGAVAAKGESRLNAFGAAWSTLETTAAMALGEYNVEFYLPDQSSIGGATLFRLEEYKLPEFEVAVKVPEEPAGSGKGSLTSSEFSAPSASSIPRASAASSASAAGSWSPEEKQPSKPKPSASGARVRSRESDMPAA